MQFFVKFDEEAGPDGTEWGIPLLTASLPQDFDKFLPRPDAEKRLYEIMMRSFQSAMNSPTEDNLQRFIKWTSLAEGLFGWPRRIFVAPKNPINTLRGLEVYLQSFLFNPSRHTVVRLKKTINNYLHIIWVAIPTGFFP
jgi:hypothetical protein